MVLAGPATWPLWLLGVAVAVLVYVAIAYLALRSVRLIVEVARRGSRRRDGGLAPLYDGQAQPTLMEVAVRRAEQARGANSVPRRSERHAA